MSPATCSPSSALSPRSAACSSPPMTAPPMPTYAVLSWNYWNHRFGGDPNILGRSVHIGDQTFEIIGVALAISLERKRNGHRHLSALSMNRFVTRTERLAPHLLMLKPGELRHRSRADPTHLSSVSRAFELDCSTCFRGMTRADIDSYLNKTLVFNPAGGGISDLQKDYRRLLGVLGLLVALVLLIACVNVANMMTAQAAARGQEMALRISIGAGRRRLVQLILCQSALLALVASVLGAFFAAWSAPFVLSLVNPPDNPARLDLPADWRVLLFGVGLMILVVLLLGLLPALRASAVRPVAALKVVKIRTRHAVSCVEPSLFRSLSVPRPLLSSLSSHPSSACRTAPRFLHRPSAPARNRCRQRPAPGGLESNCRGAPCRPRRRLGRHLALAPSRAHPHKQRYLHQRRAAQSDSRLVPGRFPGLALDDEDPPRFRSRLSPGRHIAGSRHRQRNLREDLLPRPGPHRPHL